jgi:hypothetical protein
MGLRRLIKGKYNGRRAIDKIKGAGARKGAAQSRKAKEPASKRPKCQESKNKNAKRKTCNSKCKIGNASFSGIAGLNPLSRISVFRFALHVLHFALMPAFWAPWRRRFVLGAKDSLAIRRPARVPGP